MMSIHHLPQGGVHSGDNLAPFLRIHFFCKGSGTDDIGEEDGHDTALFSWCPLWNNLLELSQLFMQGRQGWIDDSIAQNPPLCLKSLNGEPKLINLHLD
jgi:hypothetical protein